MENEISRLIGNEPLSLLVERVLERAMAIQSIPAPTFDEKLRGEFVQKCFADEGLAEVAKDEAGNVYARIPGADQSVRPVVVSAHLDTVFSLDADLSLRRQGDKLYGPGIGDNSLGLAGLFGLLWALRLRGQAGEAAIRLPGDVWLVATIGEEGLGDLRGMRLVVDRFGAAPLAYLVLEGTTIGNIYNQGLAIQRYRLAVHTPGGHSWKDYGSPSAIHELAALVTRLAALPLPVQPRTTLNVGMIAGGTSVNTIASQAHLELDLRSEGEAALDDLVRRVKELAFSAARPDVQVELELIGQRPAGHIPASHALVCTARRCLAAQGLEANIMSGSTDANIPLSRGLPAICLGLSTGEGAHTLNEYIDIPPLRRGLSVLACLVEAIFQDLESGGSHRRNRTR